MNQPEQLNEIEIEGIKFKTGKTLECDTPACREYVRLANGEQLNTQEGFQTPLPHEPSITNNGAEPGTGGNTQEFDIQQIISIPYLNPPLNKIEASELQKVWDWQKEQIKSFISKAVSKAEQEGYNRGRFETLIEFSGVDTNNLTTTE